MEDNIEFGVGKKLLERKDAFLIHTKNSITEKDIIDQMTTKNGGETFFLIENPKEEVLIKDGFQKSCNKENSRLKIEGIETCVNEQAIAYFKHRHKIKIYTKNGNWIKRI